MSRHSDFHIRLRETPTGYTAEIRQLTGPCDLVYLPAGSHAVAAGSTAPAAMLAAIVSAKLGAPVRITQPCVSCGGDTASQYDRLCDPCLDGIGRWARRTAP